MEWRRVCGGRIGLDVRGEACGGGSDGELPARAAGAGDGHHQAAAVHLAQHLWRLEQAEEPEASRQRAVERENRRLKEALATKVLEADFLQGVLRRIEARRQPVSGSGETASTRRSE